MGKEPELYLVYESCAWRWPQSTTGWKRSVFPTSNAIDLGTNRITYKPIDQRKR